MRIKEHKKYTTQAAIKACCCSVANLCLTLCDPMDCSTLISASAASGNLLKFLSIELVMLSRHLFLCHPLLLLPSILPSIMVFSNEVVLLIRWPEYWSFSINPSNEYLGLISFKVLVIVSEKIHKIYY